MTTRRRSLLGLGVAAAVSGALAPKVQAAPPQGGRAFVTRRGAAQLTVVTPPDRSIDLSTPLAEQDQLTHAAVTLVDHIEAATGARLPVIAAEDLPPGEPRELLHLGWVGPGAADGTAEALDGLDPDGYVVSAGPRGMITICGATDWGTRFGVYEFLERFVGVRWVLPGADGTHVPQADTLTVPSTLLRHEPSLRSRVLPYLYKTHAPDAEDWTSDDPQVQWATRQRTHNRITDVGSHNLYAIFPSAVYADPTKDTYQPEIYPIINGETKLPALGATGGWQPRFDIPETVDIAVEYALEYFANGRELPLLGLGINDHGGFSETDLDSDLINSNGTASGSASYFAWVNAVVSEVLRRQPDLGDKYFTVLAYGNVIDPPDFDLHPNVVPMITRETHAWQDPVIRTKLEALIAAWSARCAEWAWYDYASGTRYVAPRMHVPVIADALRHGYANGMRYQNCDLAPAVVGEGPKTWVYAKLLWDLDADVDALAMDWCRAAVGPDAAQYAYDYFAWWEEFWAERVPTAGWWQYTRIDTYFAFTLTDYLAEVGDDDLAHLRGLVESMVSHARTAPQQARAELIRDGLSYYDACAASYPQHLSRPDGTVEVLAMTTSMTDRIDGRVAAAQQRLDIEAHHESDPVLRHRTDHRRFNHNWSGFNGTEVWAMVDHLRTHPEPDDPVRAHLQQTVTEEENQAQRLSAFILAIADGESVQRAINPSFEEGSAPWVWVNHVKPVPGLGRDGGIALRLAPPPAEPTRSREEAVVQSIDITPGLLAARIHYKVTSDEAEQGQLSVRLQLLNSTGTAIQTIQQPFRLVSESTGDWTWIGVCEDIPDQVNGVGVAKVKFVASLIRFDGTGEVHFDDVEVFTEQPLPAGALDPRVVVECPDLDGPGTAVVATVTVAAAPLAGFAGSLDIALPAGWDAEPASIPVTVAANTVHSASVVVRAAGDAVSGELHEVRATAGPVSASVAAAVGAVSESARQTLTTRSASYVEDGPWAASSLSGHDGGRTRYARPGQGATASWVCDIADAGTHRISVWYPRYGLNTRSAAYSIGGDDESARLDQVDGSEWIELGWRELPGPSVTVTVTGEDARDLRTDAIRVERVVPAAQPRE